MYLLTCSRGQDDQNNSPTMSLFVNNQNVANTETQHLTTNQKYSTVRLKLLAGDRVCVKVTKVGYPKGKKALKLSTFSGIYLYSVEEEKTQNILK